MAELTEGIRVFFTLQLNTEHHKVFESTEIQSEYLHYLQQTLTLASVSVVDSEDSHLQVDMKKLQN